MSLLPHPKYRADIDGLRAVAVLVVCLYHAFPKEVHGGFIGVDIFFVISGFLISTIIFQSLDQGSFSFLEFYARRIRRIFPALIVVLLAVFAAGWFTLFPDEYKQLGKHILGGALFVSNFVLFNESGYFDAAANTKPLLHLWSLGIEEQFYILFPLAIWLASKAKLNRLTLVTTIGLLSFGINISHVYKNAVWAFYQPQSRFWELMIGAILALLVMDVSDRASKVQAALDRLATKVIYAPKTNPPPGATLAHLASWLGATLFALGIWRIHKDTAFPGTWALAPTLGAALLIWAGPRAFINKRLLANRVSVGLGKISYPLYLWHWPLLVYLRILVGDQPRPLMRAGALVAAIVLAWLTYRLIEAPVRFGSNAKAKTIALVAVMCCALGLGISTWRTVGTMTFPYLKIGPENIEIMAQLETAKKLGLEKHLRPGKTCFQLPPDKDFGFFLGNDCLPPEHQPSGGLMVIGDSHSASLSLGLRPWAKEQGLAFYQLSSGSCSLFNDEASDPACQEYRRRTFESVQSVKPNVLLIDMYWDHAGPDNRANLLQHIYSLGARQIIVVGQIPTWKGDLPSALQKKFVSKAQAIPERTLEGIDMNSLNMDDAMRAAPYPENVHYLSLKDLLCKEDGCLTKIGDDLSTDLIVWDYGHLTEAASRYMAKHGVGAAVLRALEF